MTYGSSTLRTASGRRCEMWISWWWRADASSFLSPSTVILTASCAPIPRCFIVILPACAGMSGEAVLCRTKTVHTMRWMTAQHLHLQPCGPSLYASRLDTDAHHCKPPPPPPCTCSVARELARTLRAVRAQGEASVHVHGYRGLYLYRRGDEHHWLWRSCSLYCVWITPRQPLQQTGAVVTPRGAPHNDHLHGTRQGNAGNPRNSQQQRRYESQPCVQRCE